MMRPAVFLFLFLAVASADPLPLRVVAANLTSGNHQEYSPDNGNHSNPEGAGARILQGLKPDIVLIQEFNTTVPVRQWVNATFGPEFAVFREAQEATPNFIPNGIISRFPIVEAGEWEDATQTNRDFVWARIALPGGRTLWAISVHFYAQKAGIREKQAAELVARIREKIPASDLVVLGGDLNTRTREESAVGILQADFPVPAAWPRDAAGDEDTNATRTRPYDWVLADPDLEAAAVPVKLGGASFPGGLVFDSRTFEPLSAVPPVQQTDSAAPNMQHMAVVRDFLLP